MLMEAFYFTLSRNQGGPGCVQINAENWDQARATMFEKCGYSWAFQYRSLNDVHKNDRTILKVIEA
jgi:hypothetical protein